MTKTGTSHFVSLQTAVRYYKDYGYGLNDVQQKVKDGEIHLGPPVVKDGQKLSIIDGGRYALTEEA